MDALKQFLSSKTTLALIDELGLIDETPEMQAAGIAVVGETVMTRVILEILKKLPESEHDKLQGCMDAGDPVGIMELLGEYIPNLDTFIADEARKEIAAITALAAER